MTTKGVVAILNTNCYIQILAKNYQQVYPLFVVMKYTLHDQPLATLPYLPIIGFIVSFVQQESLRLTPKMLVLAHYW